MAAPPACRSGDSMTVVPEENDSTPAKPCKLDALPTEVLLKILRFLPVGDILRLAEFGPGCKLGRVAADPSNFRVIRLSKCYKLTGDTFNTLLSRRGNDIHHLDISNCYWLTADDFRSADVRLPNLKHLDVSHTSIPFRTLHGLLSSTRSMRSLSYDDRYPVRMCDVSTAAVRTLRRLVELNAVLVPGRCLGTDGGRSLLDYGTGYRKLEAFSVDAGYGEGVDSECSCGRRLSDVIPMRNLRHFAIGQRCRDTHPISLNCDSAECSTNHRSVLFTDGCSRRKDHRNNASDCHRSTADSPPSRILSLETMHVPDLSLPPYRFLRYLNISGSFDFTGLHSVATNCRLLETLNLSYCKDALKKVHRCEEWTDLSAFRIFVELGTPLKHLNLSGLHLHLPDNELCEVISKLPDLVSLSLPVCGLPERKASVPVDCLTFGQIRSRARSCGTEDIIKCDRCSRSEFGRADTGASNTSAGQEKCAYCDSDLSQLVEGCARMQSFELIKTGFASFLRPRTSPKDEDDIQCGDIMDPESTLLCISRWKHLTSLVLAGLPSVFHGRSLVAVARGCPMLRRLWLAHLGPHPYDQCLFMDGLCEALKHTNRLLDFRFEQPKILGLQSLLQSLQDCPKLERLCLITQCGRIKAFNDLEGLMDKCVDLTVLQIICRAYYGTCTQWQQALLDKYQPSRPALHVILASYKKCEGSQWRDICDKIPFVHLDELTLFQTRVATKAPSWKEIQAIG